MKKNKEISEDLNGLSLAEKLEYLEGLTEEEQKEYLQNIDKEDNLLNLIMIAGGKIADKKIEEIKQGVKSDIHDRIARGLKIKKELGL